MLYTLSTLMRQHLHEIYRKILPPLVSRKDFDEHRYEIKWFLNVQI